MNLKEWIRPACGLVAVLFAAALLTAVSAALGWAVADVTTERIFIAVSLTALAGAVGTLVVINLMHLVSSDVGTFSPGDTTLFDQPTDPLG